MLFRKLLALTAVFLATCFVAGCWSSSPGRLHYLGDADLKYYKSQATRVDYTNVGQNINETAISTEVPHNVADRSRDEICDVRLDEIVQLALANNRIIRRYSGVNNQMDPAANSILTNPLNTPAVYDPAIQESGVLFGGRGVEAALADFDAQFSTSMLWGRDELVQNVRQSPLGPGPTIQTDTAAFRSRLQKTTAYGGIMGVNHNWDYLYSNAPGRLFPSAYTGQLSADYRQPLWAGSGVEYTRIAGPLNPSFAAVAGVSQGVVIARINNDITIADFEANVRNMLKDVELAYWDLYQQYRRYDVLIRVRNLSLKVWRDESERDRVGAGNKSAMAQALNFYFEAKRAADDALGALYNQELQLRRLCGMPVNDCKVLRPCDEPSSAEFIADWHASLCDALTRRVELRRQKWNIKSLELQLIAAKSLTNPKLDFVSNYRVNGFGDQLFGENDDDGVTRQGLHSGYETLTQGDQTGWNLGFEFSMPLGFRSAHAQVRNIELRLAKARDVLATQELEISYDLAEAFQRISLNYLQARDSFNSRDAATERVRIQTVRIETGAGEMAVEVNLLLQALQAFGTAEIGYYQALTDYNKSIIDFYLRKGMLLEHNNVHLAEDKWKPEAYKEALRRAWARSHAMPNPFVETEPGEFASPYRGGNPEDSRFAAPEAGTELAPAPREEGKANDKPDGKMNGMLPDVPEPKPLPPKAPVGDGPMTRRGSRWDERPATSRLSNSVEGRATASLAARPRPEAARAPESKRVVDAGRVDDPWNMNPVQPASGRATRSGEGVRPARFDDEPGSRSSGGLPRSSAVDDDLAPPREARVGGSRAASSERRFPSPAPEFEWSAVPATSEVPPYPVKPQKPRTLQSTVRSMLGDGAAQTNDDKFDPSVFDE